MDEQFEAINRAADRHDGSREDKLRCHELACELAGTLGADAISAVAVRIFQRLRNGDNFALAIEHIARKGGRAPGPDGITIDQVVADKFTYARRLRDHLDSGEYEHGPTRLVKVRKSSGCGWRPIHLLNMEDRIIHRATAQIVGPLLDCQFSPYSFGSRPGRDRRHALAIAERLITLGRRHCLCADIRDAYEHVAQKRVLQLAAKYAPATPETEIKCSSWSAAINESLHPLLAKLVITKDAPGVRQGAATSAMFLNLYLDRLLDEKWQKRFPWCPLLRYADDIAVFCDTSAEATDHLENLQSLLQPAGMSIKNPPDGATLIVDIAHGEVLRWLGYLLEWRGKLVVGIDWQKFQEKVAELAGDGASAEGISDWVFAWVGQLGPVCEQEDEAGCYSAIIERLRAVGINADPDRVEFSQAWLRAKRGWLTVRKKIAETWVNGLPRERAQASPGARPTVGDRGGHEAPNLAGSSANGEIQMKHVQKQAASIKSARGGRDAGNSVLPRDLSGLTALLSDLIIVEIHGAAQRSRAFSDCVQSTGPGWLRRMLAEYTPRLSRALTWAELEDIKEMIGAATYAPEWSGDFPEYIDHRRWISVIRERLASASAAEFDALGVRMTKRLQQELPLLEGVRTCSNWLAELARYQNPMAVSGVAPAAPSGPAIPTAAATAPAASKVLRQPPTAVKEEPAETQPQAHEDKEPKAMPPQAQTLSKAFYTTEEVAKLLGRSDY
ncbi:MAG: hypothetical protein K8R36_20240, partial [Planctomycetales bacterium]|nr:hypothetical protein [Planctomycetales bacterium]